MNFTLIFAIIIGILGIIVGSFLNVVILRINTGKGLGGRSQCFSCNKTLRWYELIPVVSYLIQRGRCRSCGTRISAQYMIVELITGILFFGVAYTFPAALFPVTFVLWLIWVALGVVIAGYDSLHKFLPVRPLGAFFIISMILGMNWWGMILVPLPFFILWLVSRGRWIGFGDIELMVCAGVLLGTISGFSSVMIAFWSACLIMVPWFLILKALKKNPNHQIPFGPFLLAGMYVVVFLRLDILAWFVPMLY